MITISAGHLKRARCSLQCPTARGSHDADHVVRQRGGLGAALPKHDHVLVASARHGLQADAAFEGDEAAAVVRGQRQQMGGEPASARREEATGA